MIHKLPRWLTLVILSAFASGYLLWLKNKSGTTRLLLGTIAGLSIVYQLVKLQGGDISLQSAPGKGTRLICRFPLATS